MPSFAPRAEVQRTGGRVAARSGCAVTRRSVMFAGLGVFIFAAAMSSSAWMRTFIDIDVNGGGGFATPAVLEQRPVSTAVTAASPARPAAAAAAALNAVAAPLPLPSAAASSVCALWKCSCQELANALRISHRAKEFGAAKGHPGAVRWWLENSCRANAQTKVPRGLTASILARLSVWMQQRDAPTPLAMAAPSAKVAWSSPAWVVERRWLAAEAGHAVPSFASEDAVHVMVVAGDFCSSAAHCEATTGSEPAELAEEFLQGRYRVWVTVTSMLRTLLATAHAKPVVIHVVLSTKGHADVIFDWWKNTIDTATSKVASRATIIAHVLDIALFEKTQRSKEFPMITVNPAGIFQFIKLYASAILAPHVDSKLETAWSARDLAAALPTAKATWQRALISPRNVIVMDCDNIVLVDINELWSIRSLYDTPRHASSFVAIAAEHRLKSGLMKYDAVSDAEPTKAMTWKDISQPKEGSWHRFFLREGRHVYCNSGVLLFDLTRLRAVQFTRVAIPSMTKLFSKRQVKFQGHYWPPEQDALNAMLAMQPDSFILLDGKWNANCAMGAGKGYTYPMVDQIPMSSAAGQLKLGSSTSQLNFTRNGAASGLRKEEMLAPHFKPFPLPAAILHYCGSYHPAMFMHWYDAYLLQASMIADGIYANEFGNSTGVGWELKRHTFHATFALTGKRTPTEAKVSAAVAAAGLPPIVWRTGAFFRIIQLKRAMEYYKSASTGSGAMHAMMGLFSSWWGVNTTSPENAGLTALGTIAK